MLYNVIYASMLFCGLVSIGNKAFRNVLYYIWLIGLFFFVGFRYRVGCDWSGYLNIFELARHYQSSTNATEQAFWILNRLIHSFDLEYPYINVIASGVFFIGLNALTQRQPDRFGILILSFPILIINLAMSGIRQAMAFGFLCIAYNYFNDRKPIRYISSVACAAMFHTSAMSFLMLSPFVRGEYSRKRIFAAAVLALPGVYYLLSSESFGLYARRYVGTPVEAFGAPFRTGLLAATGLAFIFFLDRKWRVSSSSNYKIVKIFSYLMVAVFPFAFVSSVGGDRFGYYLSAMQLVILAGLPILPLGRYALFIHSIPYIIFGLVLLVWSSYSSLFERCYTPYQIWW